MHYLSLRNFLTSTYGRGILHPFYGWETSLTEVKSAGEDMEPASIRG